jgi:hypothetical protein
MKFQVAYHFLRHYGRDDLLWLLWALNVGKDYAAISERLGLSKARISQIVNVLFKKTYRLSPSTVDALEYSMRNSEDDLEELRRAIKDYGPEPEEPAELRLIGGKKK